jgi:hypothetical protein
MPIDLAFRLHDLAFLDNNNAIYPSRVGITR